MAKVLFIFPSINAQEGFSHGIASLSGALEAMGCETKLIHLSDSLFDLPTADELASKVMDFDPHLICFSAMSQQYKYALEIARELKKRFPFPIAIGGVHATMVPDEVASDDVFDFIGIGECDKALPALMEALTNDTGFTSIPNIWAKTDSGYKRNTVAAYPDLELLPEKNHEIFALDEMLPKMNGWMSIITSRGCPYSCSYCFNHQIRELYKRDAGQTPSDYIRRYPIKRVIREMKTIKEMHPSLKVFIVDDDLFTLNEEYVLSFCEAYASSGLDLPFVVNGHVQAFNRRMAKALKAAGCMILKFGVESGSERIRKDVLKRQMKDKAIYEAFETAHEEGLHTSAFIMIGLPTEGRKDVDDTIDMLAGIAPGRFRWAVFYPFPGTSIHRFCLDKQLIDLKRMAALDNFYEASPLCFDPAQELLIKKLQRAFHWYVNARSSFGSAPLYAKEVEAIENASEQEWAARSERFMDEDRKMSEKMTAQSRLHYSIRFTQVMAVRSDFQEAGTETSLPAKEWKSKPRKSL